MQVQQFYFSFSFRNDWFSDGHHILQLANRWIINKSDKKYCWSRNQSKTLLRVAEKKKGFFFKFRIDCIRWGKDREKKELYTGSYYVYSIQDQEESFTMFPAMNPLVLFSFSVIIIGEINKNEKKTKKNSFLSNKSYGNSCKSLESSMYISKSCMTTIE